MDWLTAKNGVKKRIENWISDLYGVGVFRFG
jgi:hypothetical protein